MPSLYTEFQGAGSKNIISEQESGYFQPFPFERRLETALESIEHRYPCAHITIDGQPLLDLARSFEKGNLKGTVDEKLAGSYWWLGAKALIRYLESLRSKEGQRISLLGCSCGDEDCWPLECTFCRQDDFIIWKDFLHPYRRNWDYSGFGPFTFRKQQFFSELDMLRAKWYFAWKQNKRG